MSNILGKFLASQHFQHKSQDTSNPSIWVDRVKKSSKNGNILPPKIPEVACWPRQSAYRLWDPCHSYIRGKPKGVVDVTIFCHQKLA